jgi:putative transcriptional regulator
MNNQSRYDNDEIQALFLDYATGNLDEGLSLLVASLLTLCPEARGLIRQYEDLGGALIETCCLEEQMNEGALQSVLERLEHHQNRSGGETGNDMQDITISTFSSLECIPQAIYIQISTLHRIEPKWKKCAHGTKMLKIPLENSEYSAMVVNMAPGKGKIPHGPSNTEITLVLDGSYKDELGEHKKGDLIFSTGIPKHHPEANPVTGCTCLILHDSSSGLRGALKFLDFFRRT